MVGDVYCICNLKIIYELLNNFKFDLFCLKNYTSDNKNCLCNIYDKNYNCYKSCKPNKFLDENKLINKIACTFLNKYIHYKKIDNYCECDNCFEDDDCCNNNSCCNIKNDYKCFKNNNCCDCCDCCDYQYNDCYNCNDCRYHDCCKSNKYCDCSEVLIDVLITTLCEIESCTNCSKNYGYLLQLDKLNCILNNFKNILCQLKCLYVEDCNLVSCTLCNLFKIIDLISSILSKINNIECLCKLNSNCECELIECMVCELENEVDCLENIVTQLSYITYDIASREILNCSICSDVDCNRSKRNYPKKNCRTNYSKNSDFYKNINIRRD